MTNAETGDLELSQSKFFNSYRLNCSLYQRLIDGLQYEPNALFRFKLRNIWKFLNLDG